MRAKKVEAVMVSKWRNDAQNGLNKLVINPDTKRVWLHTLTPDKLLHGFLCGLILLIITIIVL